MKYIALLAGRFPLKFHTNMHQRCYSAVRRAEATAYDFQIDVIATALWHGLQTREFTVEEISNHQDPKTQRKTHDLKH
ncbi:MAG TPA: hypothetical protein VK530_03060 [Candidatus Acidoferrum sp.]|nr:hypothetical protein [Candidatus Acidoferrum sp.]